jgi:hypothetical protein
MELARKSWPRDALAVARGEFRNSGNGMSAVRKLYQRAGEGQQVGRFSACSSELSSVRTSDKADWIVIKNFEPVK